MANSLGWADTAVAATYSLTLLFLRTPLLSAVGALPTLLSAQVAFNKLRQFSLAPYRADFPPAAGASRLADAGAARCHLPLSGPALCGRAA